MPRLTTTLTPDEVSRLFDLPTELIDALLASGQVLCHVRGSETRIPLDQLETFFRDGLMNVYRAEALQGATARFEETREAPAPPVTVVLPVEEPVPAAAPITAGPDVLPPDAPDDAPDHEPEQSSPEHRRAPRYVPARQIDGYINDMKFTIVQISESGLRIRHRGNLLPGEEAKITFALLRSAQSFVIRARVVWTSLARTEGESFSISGLRVIEHADRLIRAVEILKAAHELQPERRVHSRRASDGAFTMEGISDEEISLVATAVQRFASDPVEASRWYSRARFALSDEAVRREAPNRPREREEVLGIWEYLDRQIEIPKVAGIVSWMKKTKTAVV